MPRWTRLCATALTGGCLALLNLAALVWWRSPDRTGFFGNLAEMATAAAGRRLLLLFIALMTVIVSLTRASTRLGWPSPLAAVAAGLTVPLAYVLWLLSRWARGGWAFIFLLRMSWPDVALFCLPFALSALLCAWLWEHLPGSA